MKNEAVELKDGGDKGGRHEENKGQVAVVLSVGRTRVILGYVYS